jgi:iron complex outermembrane receptor protein
MRTASLVVRSATLLALTAAIAASPSPAAGQGPDTTGRQPRVGRDTAHLAPLTVRAARSSQYLRNQGPVPVDVVPVDKLADLGRQELTQVLQYVAPSFQSETQTQADGADHVDFAQLRGLGTDQTLVLINGKRRHLSALVHLGDNVGDGTQGVDLNSIPVAAIDHIEILRDGAAAQYGSDAIAGVMNIILKSNPDGGVVDAQSGVTSRSDGSTVRASGNAGLAVGKTGYVNLTGEYRERQPTQRVGPWNGNVYFGNLFNFGQFGPNGEYNSQAEYQADRNKIAARRFDLNHVQRIGDSQLTNATFFLNSAIPVGDSAEVYGFGGLTSRTGDATAFYRFPADGTVNDTILYPDGYLPHITSDITDRSLTVGVRGTRGGWSLDVSDTYGANRFGFGLTRSLNATLPIGASPTSFDAGALDYAQNDARLAVSRRFGEEDAPDALNVSTGVEFRRETYQITAGDQGSYQSFPYDTTGGRFRSGGSEGFPGFAPGDAVNKTRTNIGGYLDGEATVAGRFVIGAAGRYENYSDFGDKVVGKLAALAKLGYGFSIRGAINTGFRAPSLAQEWTNKVSTFFQGGQPVQVGLFNNSSPIVRALGVAPLKAERSTNVSGGITYGGPRGLRAAVDLYQVKVNDRIVLSGLLNDSTINAVLAAHQIVGVQSVQFFTNAVDTRTRGIDVSAFYPWLLGRGVLSLGAAANYNTTRIVSPVRKPTGLGAQTDLIGEVARAYLEETSPPSKILASVQYQISNWSFLVRATHYGSMRSVNDPSFGVNETVPGPFITDANIGHKFGRVGVSVGGNNLLDVFPPRQKYANSFFGIFKYSRFTPWGINGAFYYTTLSYDL